MAGLGAILKASRLPMLEARILAAHALGVERVWISAHEKDEPGANGLRDIEALYSRRRAGEPIAYLTGEREFYGLSLAITPAVLIPRPETELLVDRAIPLLREGGRALDLGTGSGAIALALALNCPMAEISACDASDAALAVARANTARHGAHLRLLKSDWFAGLQGERFDLVVSNPPYITLDDPHLFEGDLRFEPREALVAGKRGLECIDAIAVVARDHLHPGGWLLLEHGYDQGEACVRLLERLGYTQVSDHRDLAENARVVQAQFDPAVARR